MSDKPWRQVTVPESGSGLRPDSGGAMSRTKATHPATCTVPTCRARKKYEGGDLFLCQVR